MKTISRAILTIISLSILISCGADGTIKKDRSKKPDDTNKTRNSQESNTPPVPQVKLKVSDALVRETKAARNYQADLEKFLLAKCVSEEKLYLEELSPSLLKNYPRSYEKTKKEDGKSFCINEIYNSTHAISRIFYTRTEGGHYGDQISLWSLNKKTNNLKQLILFSEFGKEGFHQSIQSTIESPYIFTVIQTENSTAHKNLKTVKKYKLLDNGEIVSI